MPAQVYAGTAARWKRYPADKPPGSRLLRAGAATPNPSRPLHLATGAHLCSNRTDIILGMSGIGLAPSATQEANRSRNKARCYSGHSITANPSMFAPAKAWAASRLSDFPTDPGAMMLRKVSLARPAASLTFPRRLRNQPCNHPW